MPTIYSQSPGSHHLIQNTSLGTLPILGKEWQIFFEFNPENYNNPGFTSILHLTTGGNVEDVGDRTPAIFYHPQSGLHVATTIGKNPNHYQDIKPAPAVGQWSTIFLSELKSGLKTTFSIKVNGAAPFSVDNPDPQEFPNVKVFASDPWFHSQAGSIRGLTIKTQ